MSRATLSIRSSETFQHAAKFAVRDTQMSVGDNRNISCLRDFWDMLLACQSHVEPPWETHRIQCRARHVSQFSHSFSKLFQTVSNDYTLQNARRKKLSKNFSAVSRNMEILCYSYKFFPKRVHQSRHVVRLFMAVQSGCILIEDDFALISDVTRLLSALEEAEKIMTNISTSGEKVRSYTKH